MLIFNIYIYIYELAIWQRVRSKILGGTRRKELKTRKRGKKEKKKIGNQIITQHHKLIPSQIFDGPSSDTNVAEQSPVLGHRDTSRPTAAPIKRQTSAPRLWRRRWVPAGPGTAWRGEALLPDSNTPSCPMRERAGERLSRLPLTLLPHHQTPRSSTQAAKATQVVTRGVYQTSHY